LICTNFIPWYFFSRTFRKLGLKGKKKKLKLKKEAIFEVFSCQKFKKKEKVKWPN
jgi:hypothetical protein